MKLFNKIMMLAGVVAVCALASCSDDDDYAAGAPATGSQLMAVTFGEGSTTVELDPADPTSRVITVYRSDDSQAATVPLTVLRNENGLFNVPETVTFEAGKKEGQITVTFDKAEIGIAYQLEIALDDAYVNPYLATTFKTHLLNVTRVKWNSLGKGVWYDGFWYGFEEEVEIYQRDDTPSEYRVTNPYTNERAEADGSTPMGYRPWINFTVLKGDCVKYTYIPTNAMYQDSGVEVMGFYPSLLGQDDLDANSKVVRDENGEIAWFELDPYWYVDGIGGWGIGYPCYLVFPGHELPMDEEE